jgi:hypothetical protein
MNQWLCKCSSIVKKQKVAINLISINKIKETNTYYMYIKIFSIIEMYIDRYLILH